MQEPYYEPEIQRRIDEEVSKIQKKYEEEKNEIRRKVYQIQINYIKRNPKAYFGINEMTLEEIFRELNSDLLSQ